MEWCKMWMRTYKWTASLCDAPPVGTPIIHAPSTPEGERARLPTAYTVATAGPAIAAIVLMMLALHHSAVQHQCQHNGTNTIEVESFERESASTTSSVQL